LKSDSKDSVLAEIASLIGVPARKTRRGGTIPRPFLDEVAEVVGAPTDGNKNEVFQLCLLRLGLEWQPEWDSRQSPSGGGGSISLSGLETLRDALVDFLSQDELLDFVEIDLESSIVGYMVAPETYNHEGKFEPAEIDPDKLGDGFERHNKTQNLLAGYLAEQNCAVTSPKPNDPKFDLFWIGQNGSYVCEVKSITSENEESQLRKAIGQVLRYQSQLRASGKECLPVVVTDREVSDQTWYSVFSENGLILSAAPKFNGIGPLT